MENHAKKQPPYTSNFERLLYLEHKAHMDANTPQTIRRELKQIFGMGLILYENGFTSVQELRQYLQAHDTLNADVSAINPSTTQNPLDGLFNHLYPNGLPPEPNDDADDSSNNK